MNKKEKLQKKLAIAVQQVLNAKTEIQAYQKEINCKNIELKANVVKAREAMFAAEKELADLAIEEANEQIRI